MATETKTAERISRAPVGRDGKIRYVPIIKSRGFDPSPVAGRIPIYADSIVNRSCIGTQAYSEFWEEQIYYCMHGYDTGGMHIPGRYYFFLNFMPLPGLLKESMYPFYVDQDLEVYRLVDYIKQQQKPGFICVKARRKGLSEETKTILSHGLRFIENYRGAVTAGQDVWVNGIRNKFDYGESRIRPEFRLNVLRDNDKKYEIGFEVRDIIGGFREEGYGGQLYFETMYDKGTKLEGEYFQDVICEESGQNLRLNEIVESIKPALTFGSLMLGTFYIFGTGSNILTTSRDFKDIWDNADALGFERLWIPGDRKFFPFFRNSIQESIVDELTGNTIDCIPHLRKIMKGLKPEQTLGCEDNEAAKNDILVKRMAYAKLPNKKKLKQHNQNLPLTIEEAFTTGGNNNFNDELIYAQLFEIEGDPRIKPYIFDWVREERGGIMHVKYPLEVSIRPAKENDRESEIIWVYQLPRTDIRDLDVGGIDGYNQDETQTTTSLGAMVVIRNGKDINLEQEGIHQAEYPIALYYTRPKRKEMFFDKCLMIAVAYNLIRNVMASAEQDFVIDYFIKNNGRMYLSPRPKSFDAPGGQQVHKIGAKMTQHSKPMILGIVQSMIEDYCQYNFFPSILRDEVAYDEELIGTDWDSVDAMAYAKMRLVDMKARPRPQNDTSDMYRYGDVQWKRNSRGHMVPVEVLYDESEVEMMKKGIEKLKEGNGGWKDMDNIRESSEKIWMDDVDESEGKERLKGTEHDWPFDK